MNKEILEKELYVDETIYCEKCGEEVSNKLLGDEFISYCKECNWITY